MINEHRFMWRVALAALALLAGCTKPNPLSCADGLCSDPAFPFCDVNGEVEGSAGTCIAVGCTPADFAGCRGDFAITCNATGDNFDLVECARGCEDGTGCRLCDPSETACTNGTVATCDAAGTVVSSQACPLGCFEDEPRCRDIEPSNNLGRFLDMVSDPPDLVLANAEFDTSTGSVQVAGQSIDVPSFLENASGNGVPIRVFVVRTLSLTSATISVDGDPRNPPGPGIALIARGDVTIAGEVIVQSRVGSAVAGCSVGKGNVFELGSGSSTVNVSAGGGGGGNATPGGAGGAVTNLGAASVPSATPGPVSGTAELVPLRGGCSGGYIDASGGTFPTGGGVVQISSGGAIHIAGTIDVSGGAILEQSQAQLLIGGGGAGGGILVEAPSVSFGPDAVIKAHGHAGAQACETPTASCTAGGAAASALTPSTSGGDVTGGTQPFNAGGGGGGLGRIRVNAPNATFETSNTAVLAGALTTGELATR